jgi:hypothetical protein
MNPTFSEANRQEFSCFVGFARAVSARQFCPEGINAAFRETARTVSSRPVSTLPASLEGAPSRDANRSDDDLPVGGGIDAS